MHSGIWHEITEHKAVYNMAELTDVALPYPEADAKNLFVRDDKKRNYYLITVRGDKRVDLKEFRHKYGTRALSFASENDLMQMLGLIPGAVTPLGLLNDAECKVQLYLDEAFFAAPGLIGVHPNDNTATVWLRADDLAALIQEHGNPVHIAELRARAQKHKKARLPEFGKPCFIYFSFLQSQFLPHCAQLSVQPLPQQPPFFMARCQARHAMTAHTATMASRR